MSENTKESEQKEETSELVIFDTMKAEYEHCVQRAGKLDNKVYILLTVCAFVFVLITSLIEKVGGFWYAPKYGERILNNSLLAFDYS